MTNNSKDYVSIIVPEGHQPMRLDQFLSKTQGYSRSYFHGLIKQGNVLVNGVVMCKSSTIVREHDTIAFSIPRSVPVEKQIIEQLDVKVVYEGKDFLVLNKPAGLAVHKPSESTQSVSLIDWLLLYYPQIATVGQAHRPGIVHRLDKDTSGLILIARTQEGYQGLIELFKQRLISKVYIALVEGHPSKEGTIELSIYRHPIHPLKMTWHQYTGREAITQYKVLEYLDKAALLELKPLTGRTHQLRVHCAAIGQPILGDFLYGKASPLINRQALHAQHLAFSFRNESYSFFAPPPDDFMNAFRKLKK